MLDRVLGVIDLQRGQAVRGIGGRRESYRPVVIDDVEVSDPCRLANFYIDRGVGGLYVADLDALTGGRPQIDAIAQLTKLRCPLWMDVGLRRREVSDGDGAFAEIFSASHVHVVLATESLGIDVASAAQWLDILSPERVTVSIDLMRGQLMLPPTPAARRRTSNAATESGCDAQAAMAAYYAIGVRSFVVLDLAAVGRGAGPPLTAVCRSFSNDFADARLISGGGVRGAGDVQALLNAGVDRVLVASALQQGTLFGGDAARKD